MLALGYPKEFWLRVTNSVLASVLLLLLALVALALIMDVIRRLRQRSHHESDAVTLRNTVDVGTTLPDGGENLNASDRDLPCDPKSSGSLKK